MSISLTVESNYLFYSNRKKVTKLLSKTTLDQNDLIDIFISLHIVLELGINNVFRKIGDTTLKKKIGKHKVIENLDKVNFIDKVITFIYYSKFNFNNIQKAAEYHSVINKLIDFSEMRIKLLHGYSISEISSEEKIIQSSLKKKLTDEQLEKQINCFKDIMYGLSFYLDCLDSSLTEAGKQQLKETYFSLDFLNKSSYHSK